MMTVGKRKAYASLNLWGHLMDCRVKPGNDGRELRACITNLASLQTPCESQKAGCNPKPCNFPPPANSERAVPGAAAKFQATAMNSVTAHRLALTVLLLATALAGCAANTTSTPAPAGPAPKPAMTHTRAALECWMATEHGRQDLPLDQRADIVDQCIKDKMSGKPVPAAAEPAPKPKPKN
jgi:hypothetical protein